MSLVLGGIVFKDYEIPAKVNFGGEQKLAVHKLLGGARVVDAMGPDDCDMSWHGRFQGENATGRARALDALRVSGAQVPLVFGAFFYLVVVSRVECEYERSYQIPYSVTCTVVQSALGGFAAFPVSLDTLVSADMAIVGTLTGAFSAGVP
jgi:hypothetical protein